MSKIYHIPPKLNPSLNASLEHAVVGILEIDQSERDKIEADILGQIKLNKYTLFRDKDGNIVLECDDKTSSRISVAPLHIGEHTYDGSKEVTIEVYDGKMDDALMTIQQSKILTPPIISMSTTKNHQEMTLLANSSQQIMTLINDNNIYQMN